MNAERLLNAARAVREAPEPKKFGMRTYGHRECGTPQCVLGHYAAREDLQQTFRYVHVGRECSPFIQDKQTSTAIDCDGPELQAHFDLSPAELRQLFSSIGCDNARTPEAAAEYIENFVRSLNQPVVELNDTDFG